LGTEGTNGLEIDWYEVSLGHHCYLKESFEKEAYGHCALGDDPDWDYGTVRDMVSFVICQRVLCQTYQGTNYFSFL